MVLAAGPVPALSTALSATANGVSGLAPMPAASAARASAASARSGVERAPGQPAPHQRVAQRAELRPRRHGRARRVEPDRRSGGPGSHASSRWMNSARISGGQRFGVPASPSRRHASASHAAASPRRRAGRPQPERAGGDRGRPVVAAGEPRRVPIVEGEPEAERRQHALGELAPVLRARAAERRARPARPPSRWADDPRRARRARGAQRRRPPAPRATPPRSRQRGR